jgi:hypothetical protein
MFLPHWYLRFTGLLSGRRHAVETDYNDRLIARAPTWPRAVRSSMKQFELWNACLCKGRLAPAVLIGKLHTIVVTVAVAALA